MDEVQEAVEEGCIVGAFAAGTALGVPHSATRNTSSGQEKELDIPTLEGTSGVYATIFKAWLKAILSGQESHARGFTVKVGR